jgi:hypothetical protein
LVLNIDEKIEETVMGKEWEFSTLLKLNEISMTVATELYENENSSELLNMIWDREVRITEPESFGFLYREICIEALRDKVMSAFQKHFENAKVTFTTPNKKPEETIPVPPESKSPPKPTSFSEEVETGSDGIDSPSGVSRV